MNEEDEEDGSIEFVLDNASHVNICGNAEAFVKFYSNDMDVNWFDQTTMTQRQGEAQFMFYDCREQEYRAFEMEYSKDAKVNLISQFKMKEQFGLMARYSKSNDICLLENDEVSIQFKLVHGMCRTKARLMRKSENVLYSTSQAQEEKSELRLWHNRLAHANMEIVKDMFRNNVVRGINLRKIDLQDDRECLACVTAKMKKMSFRNIQPSRATIPLHKIIAEIGFMSGVTTPSEKTCYLAVIDEASRYKWVHLLEGKGQATKALMQLIEDIEQEFQESVRILSTDDDKMFKNEQLTNFCKSKRIKQQWSHPYTPEEVCLVEKANYVLLNKTRAVLVASGMPDELWGEAIQYVAYTDNHTATKALNGKTPVEGIYGNRPSIKHLRPFACVAMMFVDKKYRKGKLSQRSGPFLLIGYDGLTRGYRLLSLATGKVCLSRYENVKCYENTTVKASYVGHVIDVANGSEVEEIPAEIPFIALPFVDILDHPVPLVNNYDIENKSRIGADVLENTESDAVVSIDESIDYSEGIKECDELVKGKDECTKMHKIRQSQ
ncbi:hypothetical protein Ae201684P_016421 [Aphanomyces euteiches]|nr:hypothetical protein Ae201684P_016421 [Aphanomyces euteiches]